MIFLLQAKGYKYRLEKNLASGIRWYQDRFSVSAQLLGREIVFPEDSESEYYSVLGQESIPHHLHVPKNPKLVLSVKRAVLDFSFFEKKRGTSGLIIPVFQFEYLWNRP